MSFPNFVHTASEGRRAGLIATLGRLWRGDGLWKRRSRRPFL